MVKLLIDKILNTIAMMTPRKLLYFMVIRAWAIATTEKYTNKTPDQVTWDMVCKYLDNKRGKSQ
jgi:hypothetical protein